MIARAPPALSSRGSGGCSFFAEKSFYTRRRRPPQSPQRTQLGALPSSSPNTFPPLGTILLKREKSCDLRNSGPTDRLIGSRVRNKTRASAFVVRTSHRMEASDEATAIHIRDFCGFAELRDIGRRSKLSVVRVLQRLRRWRHQLWLHNTSTMYGDRERYRQPVPTKYTIRRFARTTSVGAKTPSLLNAPFALPRAVWGHAHRCRR
jgi:hypothetical protein